MRVKLLNFENEDISLIRDTFPGIIIVTDNSPVNFTLDKNWLAVEDTTKIAIRFLKDMAKYCLQEYIEDPDDPLEI